MRKKILSVFVLFFCAAVCALGFTACGTDGGTTGGGKHTHTYSEKWSNDKDEHWRVCACGDKTDVNKHDFGSGDKCSVCSYSKEQGGSVDVHKHEYKTEVVEATCTEDGYCKYVCACGHSYTESKDSAKGHTLVTDEAVDPTCTETGLTEGSHCGVCSEVFLAQQTIPANGHTPVTDYAVDPTCTETGLTEGSHCDACKEVFTAQQTIPANGHTPVTDYAVEPTCTETGLTEGSRCSVCKEVFTAQQTIPASGHTPVTDYAVEPTCTETGLTEGSHCDVCDEVITAQETVPAKGHTPVTDDAVDPTCTETGLTEGSHCDVCDEVLTAQETVPANGHTPVTDDTVDPTCTETGLTEGSHCDVCDEVLTAQKTVPANGHDWVYSNENALYHTSTCKVCDTVIEEDKHDWNDNVCLSCGYDAGGSKGLKYQFTETEDGGYYTVTGIGECSDTDLIIPAVYNGYPVTKIDNRAFYDSYTLTGVKTSAEIGNYAFYNCKNISSVDLDGCPKIADYAFGLCPELTNLTIPASVVSIGEYAFWACKKLKTVEVLPQSGLTSIGKQAFRECDAIEEITLPFIGAGKDITQDSYFGYIFGSSNEDVPAIELITVTDSPYIKPGAFMNCAGIKRVAIECDGEISIGDSAFYECGSLSEVTLPDNIKSIGEDAFYNTALTVITIPAGVTDMGGQVFYGCKSLLIYCKAKQKPDGWDSQWAYKGFNGRNFYSHPVIWDCDNNSQTASGSLYKTLDGLLYELKDGKATVGAQPADITGSIVIPSSVTYAYNSFSVESIAYEAFYKCSKITDVSIPAGVTYIGNKAFDGCSSLKSITVDPNNTNYKSLDGILYNKAGTEFIHVPQAITGNVTISDGITKISGYFYGCSALSGITVPDSVKLIDQGVFRGCVSLKTITLPFVGRELKTETDTYQYPLGYIFGTSAYTGGREIEQQYYGYESNDGSLTIVKTKYYIPESLKTVKITGGKILYGAFYGCDCVEKVILPDGLTSIADEAFYSFNSLKSVSIPESVQTIGYNVFYGCSSLKNLTLPEDLTSFGYGLVYNCTSLKSIYIGSAVSYDGWYYLFEKCLALESITISENNAKYCGINGIMYNKDVTEIIYVPIAIKGNVIIPESITDIGRHFYGRSFITEVTVPDGVTSLGTNAFEECTSLKRVSLPEGLTSIGTQAFWNCNSLTEITIPEGVTELKLYTFAKCSSLVSVTIPANVRVLGDCVFYQCTALESIIFNNVLESIGFQTFVGCVNLKSVSIPDSVTEIDKSAFQECEFLESILVGESNTAYSSYDGVLYNKAKTQLIIAPQAVRGVVRIPDGVIEIPAAAFYKCKNLTEIILSDSVKIIGGSAFYECPVLESVTIAGSVTRIDEYAFWKCSAIKNLTILSTDIEIDGLAFLGCNSVENAIAPSYAYSYFLSSNGLDAQTKLKTAVITCGDRIDLSAFASCSSLVSVTIADTITSIGVYAFMGCTSLAEIDFDGTTEQWRDIVKESNWYYNSKISIVHCSNGDSSPSAYYPN